METQYVDNDVWRYRIALNQTDIDKTIYTKEIPEYYELSDNERIKYKDSLDYYMKMEDLIQEKYFTKERIQEYKDLFCKIIQESENPFNICCVDTDRGYNVTEDMLFDYENS